MNLEIIILSEVRKRQISYDIAYMWNLKKKKWYKWTYLQNKKKNKTQQKQAYDYQRGKDV